LVDDRGGYFRAIGFFNTIPEANGKHRAVHYTGRDLPKRVISGIKEEKHYSSFPSSADFQNFPVVTLRRPASNESRKTLFVISLEYDLIGKESS
jgi:hypothetical protein